jgi:hypothetical protein
MGHTLGPFTVCPAKKGQDKDFAVTVGGYYIIGEAYNQIAKDVYADAEANARLWAAAPDLLAACEAFKTAVQNQNVRLQIKQGTWDTVGWEIVKAAQMMDAAIAAAKGEGAD